MSLRRISDLSPAQISKNNINQTKNMLFEVSYPTTSEANMYISQALTYNELSIGLLSGIFDWMFSGNKNSMDLSGNFYFNEYRNSNHKNLRDTYQCRFYFNDTFIGGQNSGIKLLKNGVSEITSTDKIQFNISQTDAKDQTINADLTSTPVSSPNLVIEKDKVTTNKLYATDLCATNTIKTRYLSATVWVECPTLFANTAHVNQNMTVGNRLTVGSGVVLNSNGDITGSYFSGLASRACWGDLAEYYIADNNYESGTLLKFGGDYELTIADDEVNAVVTSKPGFVLNSKIQADDDGYPIAIALVGRTPVKVIGKVKKFQNLMLSNIPGIAIVSDGTKPTIGKALKDKDTDEIDLVECVVKLKL